MSLTASQRVTLFKEISKRLEVEDWPFVDVTLSAFGVPVEATWNGSLSSYILHCLKDATDTDLVELAEHVGFSQNARPVRVDPPFWRAGFFRLFITHLSAHKKFAAQLQEALDGYAITAFVAHNDIEPTKEWQIEIETALNTCDALAALLHPGFHASNWTDQEIGYVMGRGIPVVSVKMGQDPYGFIGKFQACNGAGNDASKIATALYNCFRKGKQTQKQMSKAVVNAFVQSRSFAEAKSNMALLEDLTVWEPSFKAQIQSAVKHNVQIRDSFYVPSRVEALLREWKTKA